MTKRIPHPISPAQQARSDEWRALVGPGHQFPTLNDRILTHWTSRRPR